MISKYDRDNFTIDEVLQATAMEEAAKRGEVSWEDAHAAQEKVRAQYGYSGGADGSKYVKTGQNGTPSYASPEYKGSKYDALVDAAMKKYSENSYTDYTKGDEYAALRDRYAANARRGMEDTVGVIAQRTGGLASSYAQTAGQQQYDRTMEALEDTARKMYDAKRSEDADKVSMARALAQDDYGRYTDTVTRYQQDRAYRNSMDRQAAEDARYADETRYQTGRDAVSDARYAAEQEAEERKDARTLIGSYVAGNMIGSIPQALMQRAGYTADDIKALAAENAIQTAKKSSSSSGSSSGSSSAKYKKPDLSPSQTLKALQDGVVNDTTKAAYEYYYGQPYEETARNEADDAAAEIPEMYADDDAYSYLYENGVPEEQINSSMTRDEFSRRNGKATVGGKQYSFKSYGEYIDKLVEVYGR